MPTITLYAGKANQVPGLMGNARRSVREYRADLEALRTKVLTIDGSTCDVEEVIRSIRASSQTQEAKEEALGRLEAEVEGFLADVVRIDGEVADVINRGKEDFYEEHPYLKPDCEKNGWERFKDGCKKFGQWCREHWKAIVTAVVVIAAVVCLFIPGVNAAIAGMVFGKVILGAAAGALMGAVSGGLVGGITSVLSGGSFWDGVEEGAFTGALTGALFGGLGGAGQLAGNILGKSCAFVGKFGSVVKWTSRISAGISGVMGLYDTAAFAIGLFAPDCAFVQLNQKLHSSKLYNGFQMGVSALAIFSGGMRKGMSQVKPSCFVAGTLVLTAMGLVAIENVRAGDRVRSKDPETMEAGEKAVLETYVREVEKLVRLTVNGEELVTTFDHPFYVRGRGFVNACELWVGAQLLDACNGTLVVENTRLELAGRPVRVYNFQVEGYHTYYVGENGVWVHNAEYKVKLSRSKYPESAKHIEDAIEGGQPKELTINRSGAKTNRRASLKGIDKVPGMDLDEYPFAMCQEGGSRADIRAIGRSDNRGAGSSISHQLRGLPDGTTFEIEIVD